MTVVLFFVGLELSLRVLGFEAATRVESLAFTFPMDDYNRDASEPFLERDELLFWKPRAGIAGHNALSCFGPEFSANKPQGVFRIVCLGDSCTHFGPEPYSAKLQTLLDQSWPGRFEVINAGVIGYTSHQGLELLRSKVVAWQPDLVTVYFGWNDHWLARDFADKDQRTALPSAARVRNALDQSRIVQLLAAGVSAMRPPTRPGLRVELADYQSNLMNMNAAAESCGSRLWFLTAPQALDLGIPDYLMSSGEVDDPALLVSLHRQFNEVVRAVGKECVATVLDLDQEMDAEDKQSLFEDDHIHLTELGKTFVAKRLLQELEDQRLTDREAQGSQEVRP